ncbi:MAG: peptidase T [Clostridia bacterium]|nr:peptidase T [Clostridia bacterium]
MTVKQYFERYISIGSASDEASADCPSTTGQLMLGMVITGDLCEMGIFARQDDHGYVYATIPATAGMEDAPRIGLIAHMDTSPAVSGEDIRHRTVYYGGGDILLNPAKNIYLRAQEHPHLQNHVFKHLIVTDGTTLLGADDKAGIAEIMALCEFLVTHPEIPHGAVEIAFTPDEEIGRGTDHFDLEHFEADFAYTVDGGALGELEYENFNAASAVLSIDGISTHPGTAKDVMVNAALLAGEFMSMLPADERPETTEGYEGFYHLCDVTGDCEHAKLVYIIRDHDKEKFEARKAFFGEAAEKLQTKYPKAKVQAEVADSYYNMRQVLEDRMDIVDRAADAMRACNVEPIVQPIRGGTDGARLSFEGLPCPNLSTGGYNFHSRFEYIPVEDMETMVEVLKKIVTV